MDKQTFAKGLLITLLLSGLAACAHTGGDIGGLVPAPKFLKGSISGSTYTSKDGLFTVTVPHAQGSYEYTYMQVKEQYGNGFDYVSFGPAATDQSIYRVNLEMRPPPGAMQPSLDDAAPAALANCEAQIQKIYGVAPKVTSNGKTQIDGHDAYYWQLKQVVPVGKLNSTKPVTLIHDIYVMDFPRAIAIVWVQSPANAPAPNSQMTPILFAISLKLKPVGKTSLASE